MLPLAYQTNIFINSGADLDQTDLSKNRKHVLIIDDDSNTVDMLKLILMGAGMDVSGAFSGREAIEKCMRTRPDVILLDLMMPDMDGWETYRHLRTITQSPVIILSAKDQPEDIVCGLQVGADDYISKPFNSAVLIARVNTILHRYQNIPKTFSFVFPKIKMNLNLENNELTIRGKQYYLPGREIEVLGVLARHAPDVVKNETIAKEVWGTDDTQVRRRIKYLVFLLRQKLEEHPSSPKLLISQERVGYYLSSEG